jgi:hypothetical protein
MIRRNFLRRLENLEASLLPEQREVLNIIVTNPWGIINEFQIELLPRRNRRDRLAPPARASAAGSPRTTR